MQKITLLQKRVLIKIQKKSEETFKGIILQPQTSARFIKGEVEEVSADISQITNGQTVLFDSYGNIEFLTEAQASYVIVNERDVICVVDNDI